MTLTEKILARAAGKAKVSAATAKIRWNVFPSRFQVAVFPPDPGANVSCANIQSVVMYLYYAYQSGTPVVDNLNPGVLPYYVLKAAEVHEMKHVSIETKTIKDAFKKVRDQLSRKVLGTALGTSPNDLKANLQMLEMQALADWISEVKTRLAADYNANEKKAADAGKPSIKPALKQALSYAKKTCKLNLNLPT